MFAGATKFNQPLNNWDVSKVTTMSRMFRDAKNFNQPLDNWDVSKVTNMSWMFAGATKFNPYFAPNNRPRTRAYPMSLKKKKKKVKTVGDIDNSKTKRSFCNIS